MGKYADRIADIVERGVMERGNSNFDIDGYIIHEIFMRYGYEYDDQLPDMEFEKLCFVRYDLYNADGELDDCYIQNWYKDILLNDYLCYDLLSYTTMVGVNGVTVDITDKDAISNELIDECAT